MGGSFRNYFLTYDKFGHDVTLNYKGNNEFPTCLGAFLSILLKLLTIAYLVQRIISLVLMQDPTTTIFSRPIYETENQDLGVLNLHDYRFNMGVIALDKNSTKIDIEPNVGRFSVKHVSNDT